MIIDLKSGRIVDRHREDLRFYALVETLCRERAAAAAGLVLARRRHGGRRGRHAGAAALDAAPDPRRRRADDRAAPRGPRRRAHARRRRAAGAALAADCEPGAAYLRHTGRRRRRPRRSVRASSARPAGRGRPPRARWRSSGPAARPASRGPIRSGPSRSTATSRSSTMSDQAPERRRACRQAGPLDDLDDQRCRAGGSPGAARPASRTRRSGAPVASAMAPHVRSSVVGGDHDVVEPDRRPAGARRGPAPPASDDLGGQAVDLGRGRRRRPTAPSRRGRRPVVDARRMPVPNSGTHALDG